jgi:hypothetical protein
MGRAGIRKRVIMGRKAGPRSGRSEEVTRVKMPAFEKRIEYGQIIC